MLASPLDIVILVNADVLENELAPMLRTPAGRDMVVKAVAVNALSPMNVTEFGIVICDNDVAVWNILDSIRLSPVERVIWVKADAPSNALDPMLVTEFGIVIWVKLVAP